MLKKSKCFIFLASLLEARDDNSKGMQTIRAIRTIRGLVVAQLVERSLLTPEVGPQFEFSNR